MPYVITHNQKVPVTNDKILTFYQLGDYYQGGNIVYIAQPGDPIYVQNEFHGLIASSVNIGVADWGPTNINISGTKQNLFYGASNSSAILAGQGTSSQYAASLCATYSCDGYNDWYLPSYFELAQWFNLYKATIGNLGFGGHWTSTQYSFDITAAWKISGPASYTPDGTCCYITKISPYGQQPVRAFRTF